MSKHMPGPLIEELKKIADYLAHIRQFSEIPDAADGQIITAIDWLNDVIAKAEGQE